MNPFHRLVVFRRAFLLIATTVALTSSVLADTEKRVALVIGNSSYKDVPLKNPVNDATDMAAKLRRMGFEVIEKRNLTSRQIGSTLHEFSSKLSPGAVALVFYAGHGLQIKGENYLPGIDAEINSELDVPNQSIAVRQIMDVLDDAKTRLNLVFLDACRNNPYARSFRSNDRGLARVSAPSGTLISYATRPGSVAADGAGRNGLYTSQLLRQMDQSGQPIEQVLKRVVSDVKAASEGRQEPWMEGSIEGDFCFGVCGDVTQVANLGSEPSLRARSRDEIEDGLWDSVKDSRDANLIDEYLRQYPQGRYLGPARVALAKLRGGKPLGSEAATGAVTPAQTWGSDPQPGTVIRDCSDCPEMVMIPAGSFIMGSDSIVSGKPVHSVRLNAFAIGKTEITQGQWQAVMGSNPSNFTQCGSECPVEQVSWDDAQEFVRKLSAKTGRQYRLPSEAEWEYACRGGRQNTYCGGDDVNAVAWYGGNVNPPGNSAKTTNRVAMKQVNTYGLYDMSGNVWEWVQDCWNENYQGAPTDGGAWTSGNCGQRVLRGGSWADGSESIRVAHRVKWLAAGRLYTSGFRLVRKLP